MTLPIILHIPHASRFIPRWVRRQLLLDDAQLIQELDRITDHETDTLFDYAYALRRIVSPVSRLVCDVERFPIDDIESMAKIGMGVIYQRTTGGNPLRIDLDSSDVSKMMQLYYMPHHANLNAAVDDCLYRFGKCLIIDCHSFQKQPLPYEDPTKPRPMICIGTDMHHTPSEITMHALTIAQKYYADVAIDVPFSGTLVSSSHYLTDDRVKSLMIEVRKDLYLHDLLPNLEGFRKFQRFLQEFLETCPGFGRDQ